MFNFTKRIRLFIGIALMILTLTVFLNASDVNGITIFIMVCLYVLGGHFLVSATNTDSQQIDTPLSDTGPSLREIVLITILIGNKYSHKDRVELAERLKTEAVSYARASGIGIHLSVEIIYGNSAGVSCVDAELRRLLEGEIGRYLIEKAPN